MSTKQGEQVQSQPDTVFDKISTVEAVANQRVQEEQQRLDQAFEREQEDQLQRIRNTREAVEKEGDVLLSTTKKECAEILQQREKEAKVAAEQWKDAVQEKKHEAITYLLQQFVSLKNV